MISRQDISVLYDVSVLYDISVWHDTTAVWCDILSQTCTTGIMTFRCVDPSVCWPFGVLALLCSGVRCFGVWGFHQTMQSHWRDYSYMLFRTTKKVRYCQGEVSPHFQCAMIRHGWALASLLMYIYSCVFRGVNAGAFYHCVFSIVSLEIVMICPADIVIIGMHFVLLQYHNRDLWMWL